ncbi:V-set domain containing T-cell activation inhibitor 1 B7 -like protein 4 [Channa argus]|uniref:V-set domain containing T-cell activation inhibitor 1 B7-like protein 4 n=1 Tax=Channa argus TaxID=215402 RepID=A0A6G1QN07_CHAAH|nr:V-set domain containing T-cell activation inhibitor 1 B7 -like protein 4 [Channa argus]KAK2886747.1 hypothetical protein Q8A73_020693 [Channa argus]
MSAIHTWVCFLLWISFSTQHKTPDVTVTCFISEECLLPCTFQPDGEVTIKWFRQDVQVYEFKKEGDNTKDDDEDDDEDDDDSDSDSEENDDDSSEELDQLDERISVFPALVSRGNATLILRESSLKDRGTYKCHVKTSNGEHHAKVILKVEAPIRELSLELSRMSGYDEMICTVHHVFPAPRVTWATEPQTFEDLRPVTRVQSNQQGLYTVHSRLKLLNSQPNLIYICKVTSPYGGPAWWASLREREIKGSQGKDLTIPCFAPSYLNKPSLEWNFSAGTAHSRILTYDSQSGHSTSASAWEKHVELDGYRVPFGDGSLRLMDPVNSKHTGSYTCKFSVARNTHSERSDVIIDGPQVKEGGQVNKHTKDPQSYWWIAGLVIAGLALALVGLLVYLKLKGNTGSKPRNDPKDLTELNVVTDGAGNTNVDESRPLNVPSSSRPPGTQADSQ